MEKTLEQIKEDYAQSHNTESWDYLIWEEPSVMKIREHADEIAELYATQKAKEAWDRACKYLLKDIAKTIREGNESEPIEGDTKIILETLAEMMECYPYDEYKEGL